MTFIAEVPPDGVIPSIHNLCASFQLTVTRHLCHRVQRAMEYVKRKELIPPDKQILVRNIYKLLSSSGYTGWSNSVLVEKLNWEELKVSIRWE